MKVAVLGLWHLGSVTAACLAATGHAVKAYDPDPGIVATLAAGRPPVAEPGLAELIGQELESRRLKPTSDLHDAVNDADTVWITFDTPVDEEDIADTAYVRRQIEASFPHLKSDTLVLCSSQLPVGTIRQLEETWAGVANGRDVSFASSPENLRLGKAIDVFLHPDRVIVGVRDERARARAEAVFRPVTDRLEWMSVESAEMTKHAVNAFLATSVTFINELAGLCEPIGADAKEVERGLRTEQRIGPRAYLSPGGAFAGGTLARDVSFLRELGKAMSRPTPLMDGVSSSNTAHRLWAQRRLASEFGQLAGTTIAVWGLTYKPGTDTLRRSDAVALCRWLTSQGATVHVHDPAAAALPDDMAVVRHDDPLSAAAGARALILATAWPVYRDVDLDQLAQIAPRLLVLDANRFLGPTVGNDARFRLVSVGTANV